MTDHTPPTTQQLDDIEQRANAATPGPWCTDSWEIYQGAEFEAGAEWIGETCRSGEMDDGRADAEFVAHARTDVPALLAEVRRLRAVLDRTRALALLEAADFLRDTHHQYGMNVQEIGTALRNAADDADPMVGSLARDGFGLDEIADMLSRPVVSAVVETGEANA